MATDVTLTHRRAPTATLYDLDRGALTALLAGEPRYRVEQLWDGLYRQALLPADMTNLPKALRGALAEAAPLALAPVTESTSGDGQTVKSLWRLHDDRRTDAEDTVAIRVGAPVTERETAQPAPPTVPPRALDIPPPVVASPELAASSPRAKLPPPPLPQLRPPRPVRAVAGEQLARRAATLTSFPLQPDEGGTSAASASDWEEAERSPLNTTLPGVGRHG